MGGKNPHWLMHELLHVFLILSIVATFVVTVIPESYWNLYDYTAAVVRFKGWEVVGDAGWQESEVWAHYDAESDRITDHKFSFRGEGNSGIIWMIFPWHCYQTHTYHNDGHNNVRAWSTDVCKYELWVYFIIESGITGICVGSGHTTTTAEVFAP